MDSRARPGKQSCCLLGIHGEIQLSYYTGSCWEINCGFPWDLSEPVLHLLFFVPSPDPHPSAHISEGQQNLPWCWRCVPAREVVHLMAEVGVCEIRRKMEVDCGCCQDPLPLPTLSSPCTLSEHCPSCEGCVYWKEPMSAALPWGPWLLFLSVQLLSKSSRVWELLWAEQGWIPWVKHSFRCFGRAEAREGMVRGSQWSHLPWVLVLVSCSDMSFRTLESWNGLG